MRKYLKRISLAMALVLLCAGLAFAAVPADVAGAKYSEAITALINVGAITGDTDGLFHPTDNLTRAQACVIVVKTIDPPNAEIAGTATQSLPKSGFSDMKGYGWAEGYISYAVKNGIVKGYPDGTFRPGSNVSSNEMLTMVLRAAGLTDAQIGTSWPADYITKATSEGVLTGIETPYPSTATKEIAAQMTYNKMKELQARGAAAEPAAGVLPGVTQLTFATGKFNDLMTTYAGIPISDDVVVYTYGLKKDYTAALKLPSEEKDYHADTVYKFKLAETPCFYSKSDGEITAMILPMDAGFSGRIYGVINDSTQALNGSKETVNNIYTLAAAQKVAWLTKDSSVTVPSAEAYLAGEVYELTATDGIIKKIATAGSGEANKHFKELTAGSVWNAVKGYSDGIVTLEVNNDMIAVADHVVVYVLSDDGKSYSIGKPVDIQTGASIRAYTISEDEEVASLITLKKK